MTYNVEYLLPVIRRECLFCLYIIAKYRDFVNNSRSTCRGQKHKCRMSTQRDIQPLYLGDFLETGFVDIVPLCYKPSKWKSCSMRIGPRCNAKCANIVSLSGQCISWVTELRYLGIFLTCSRIFTCSTDSFYRSANAIFGKVGRIASEETVLELIKTKCIPALMFGKKARY